MNYKNYKVLRMTEKEKRLGGNHAEWATIRAKSEKEAEKMATVGGYIVISVWKD